MKFDDFKKRYAEKFRKMGATELPDEDTLATIYLALVVFLEWETEQMKLANKKAAEMAKKPNIIVPGRRSH